MRLRKRAALVIIMIVLIFVLKNKLNQMNEVKDQPSEKSTVTTETQINEMSEEENEVSVTFIDVGQGDSTLICDGNEAMLIDTGAYEGYDNLIEILYEKNIDVIDVLVLTHPDADHIQNAVDIMENYVVSIVYMPDTKTDTKTYQNLIETMDEKDIPVINPSAGDVIDFGSANYQILATGSDGEYEDTNSSSIVIRMENGEDSFLFMGDATGEEMSKTYSSYDVASDVLKASHHGSANSSCNDELLFYNTSPEAVVISCGYGNDYGHPHKETMELIKIYGSKLYRTDLQGTIECISTGDGIIWLNESCTNYKNGNSF